ncbi:acyltransferase family protein [Campylobacter sp. CCUG 57310]|uniref:acyltransferase family protein n=1 Tax=Campylobacter sp. CCUG 57310 TaxID=2517362 RepID=UPI001567316B|nr:acyltransferase family protein [Campylobacter sp. CCUG 57310]QKF91988.1 acyltransferase [Campylobacter sp. CCUG 57310]
MHEINLNYFRDLFATLVVFARAYQILLLPLIYHENSIFLKIVQFIAAYAVVGFILISGYSIASSLHSNYLNNNKRRNIKEFIIKRFNRIIFPFVLSIIVVTSVVFFIKYFSLNGSETYLFLFLNSFISDIGNITMDEPLWILNFEVYFYILLLVFSLFFTNYNLNNFKRNISFVFFMGSISYYIRYYKMYYINNLKKGFFIFLGYLVFLLVFNTNYIIPYTGKRYNIMILLSLTMILFYVIYISKRNLYMSEFFYSISKYSYTLCVIHFPLLLSLSHENLYVMSFLEILFLLILGNFMIFNISKYCSYFVERRNYK